MLPVRGEEPPALALYDLPLIRPAPPATFSRQGRRTKEALDAHSGRRAAPRSSCWVPALAMRLRRTRSGMRGAGWRPASFPPPCPPPHGGRGRPEAPGPVRNRTKVRNKSRLSVIGSSAGERIGAGRTAHDARRSADSAQARQAPGARRLRHAAGRKRTDGKAVRGGRVRRWGRRGRIGSTIGPARRGPAPHRIKSGAGRIARAGASASSNPCQGAALLNIHREPRDEELLAVRRLTEEMIASSIRATNFTRSSMT